MRILGNNFFYFQMTDRRRTSETQMADLTVQVEAQNDMLKNIRKNAEYGNQMTNNIQG